MTLIARFAKQKVTLQRRTLAAGGTPALNDYGEPLYDAPVTILGRFEPSSGTRRTETGDEVEVENTLLTAEEIRLSDKVEGNVVHRVETIVAKSGRTLGYQAFM